MPRKRHLARIAVMQVLFERETRDVDAEESLERITEELGNIDQVFAEKLLKNTLDKEQDLKEVIQKHAPDWSLERMDPIARSMLLVGAYELIYGEDAPPAVVMNEAIEIAKEYGTSESSKFVNGVLNAIAHRTQGWSFCPIDLHCSYMSQAAPVVQLEKSIGITFRDKDLLHQALTHRSAVRRSMSAAHNERLEFLGDAVLELVTTEHLFKFSDKSEGELTSWRAALVQGEQLAVVAKELKLGDFLFMSKGEEASGGREKISTLANALEALIGAIFLDQGYEVAFKFCNDFILIHLGSLLAQGKDKAEKSLFQEKAQEMQGITPHYEVISETGPDHDKKFVCGAYIDKEKVAEGKGNSKQRAEQDSAKNAIKEKGWK